MMWYSKNSGDQFLAGLGTLLLLAGIGAVAVIVGLIAAIYFFVTWISG